MRFRVKPGWTPKDLKSDGKDGYSIDKYPPQDEFIPQAEMMADEVAIKTGHVDKDGNPMRGGSGDDKYKWSHWFLAAMDNLLVEAGMRVLPECPAFCSACGGDMVVYRTNKDSPAMDYCIPRTRVCKKCGKKIDTSEIVTP